jgi:DNA-binding TFAR19-related protein (PDSD5 family)
MPIQITASNVAEEAEIKALVENFAKRLQNVSLQAPDAAQEMEKQYAEFVSPALLALWKTDVFKAPGRIGSK